MSASAETDPAGSTVKMEVDAPQIEAPSGDTPAVAAETAPLGDPAATSGGAEGKHAGMGYAATLMKEGDTVILEHKISNHANEIRFVILKYGPLACPTIPYHNIERHVAPNHVTPP